jgi:hypothetical protein
MYRLKTFKSRQILVSSFEQIIQNPYCYKPFRKLIDTSAFTIYGHWVKRGEQQNRAALFELEPKKDLILIQNRNDNS